MLVPVVQVLGLCGTLSNGSTESALRIALSAANGLGARVEFLGGTDLDLPAYSFAARSPGSVRLLNAVREADAVLLASPAYHGSVSGLLKNALDYLQELATDDPPYLDGKAVGCVGVAGGWQGSAHVLRALRDVTHALRGWPVPMGAALNCTLDCRRGVWAAPQVEQLSVVAAQVVEFAAMRRTLS